MPSKIWAIAIPAIIGVCGYLYKVWAERVKSRKLVLFHLLEIHYALKILPVNIDDLGAKYVEHCKGCFADIGLKLNDQASASITKFTPTIQGYFGDIVGTFQHCLDERFKESFEKSLQELAKDNPVLAYRLRGRLSFDKIASAVMLYTKSLKDLLEDNNSLELKDVLKKEILDAIVVACAELQSVVDEDIKSVSLGCDPLTWWNCRQALKKKIDVNETFELEELRSELTVYMTRITESAARSI